MSTAAYVGKRVLRMVPALLGITLVTFLLMDLAPSSRAELHGRTGEPGAQPGQQASAQTMQLLREHWGMIDPETKEPYSVWHRYGQWLGRACTLDFAGPGEDAVAFRDRVLRALPVTLLLNTLALAFALGIALPLGARLGMSAGGLVDKGTSGLMFLAFGVPEFLLATLLLLSLGGGWMDPVFPSGGLQSEGAARLPAWAQAWDMASHLVLPVLALAVGPCVVVTRYLRDSVARAARGEFVLALRGWGLSEKVVRRRALHAGMSPLVTLLGVLLPGLVGGSVVVENVFSLPGLGQLAFDAVMRQEYPMVMAMTVLVAVVTLFGLLLSDLLHRAVDPRVELR